ncbi:carboxylesterase family protein [Clostridioides difficile]
MNWIHGRGFFFGCETMPYYDGTHFAMEDIIVVTINYILGAIGFLALETSLKKYGTTGNCGTLDEIQALKWVNENIDDFGRDPSRITIYGESAG